MKIYNNNEIKIFFENLISFIRYKFLYSLGFIEKNGEPNRCINCLSTKFTYKTTDTINSIVCEQEMLCSNLNWTMNKKEIRLNRSDLIRCKKNLPINQITLYDFKKESMNLTEAYLAYTVIFEDEEKAKILKSRF